MWRLVAAVADGATHVVGRSVGAAEADELDAPVRRVGRGLTLREAGIELSREYRERRAETPMVGTLFTPANLVGGDSELPGDMLFPGEMIFPGEMVFPGEMRYPGSDEPSVRVAGVSTIEVSEELANTMTETGFRLGDVQPQLIRAARGMAPEAYESGEPFLVFFLVPPKGGATEVVFFLRKRPGRAK
jgi:hypothetical protein